MKTPLFTITSHTKHIKDVIKYHILCITVYTLKGLNKGKPTLRNLDTRIIHSPHTLLTYQVKSQFSKGVVNLQLGQDPHPPHTTPLCAGHSVS